MYKTVILFYFLLAASVCSHAGTISMNEFLESAKTDYTLGFQKEKINFLKSSSSNTPFLNAIELRTRTNRYDINRQRYTVRLRPNGWGEGKIGKKVYDITLEYNESQHQLLYNDALKRRYLIMIDLLHNRALIDVERSLMVLYEDKINVLKKSVSNLDFDARDLIEAEDKVIGLQLDLINRENDIANIEDDIRRIIPVEGPITLDMKMMAGHGMITLMMDKLPEKPGEKNIHLKTARMSAELAREQYNLEKVENRRYVRYLEANYDMEEQNELERALSLEIGVTLPIVNPNRLDINRRKMDSLREKRRYEYRKRDIAEDMITTLRSLKRLLAQYDVLNGKKETSKAESSLETYMGVEGADPLILLKFKESMLKTDIALEKINNRIYTKYIDLLDISGKLVEQPAKNYLCAGAQETGQ
jgi:hypothetical protein